eukprot:413571_1
MNQFWIFWIQIKKKKKKTELRQIQIWIPKWRGKEKFEGFDEVKTEVDKAIATYENRFLPHLWMMMYVPDLNSGAVLLIASIASDFLAGEFLEYHNRTGKPPATVAVGKKK